MWGKSRLVPNPVVTVKAEENHPVLNHVVFHTHPIISSVSTSRTFKTIMACVMQIFTVWSSATIFALYPFAWFGMSFIAFLIFTVSINQIIIANWTWVNEAKLISILAVTSVEEYTDLFPFGFSHQFISNTSNSIFCNFMNSVRAG